ncbi:MAG: DUF3310 domain-containing protein [Salinibacterium sp.]|nr:MAG: DUF3310 domain-containing protein [Salinibacterium sp.]
MRYNPKKSQSSLVKHPAEPASELTVDQVDDAINHPTHYTSHPSGVECITVVEHFGFNVGSTIKYLWRCGLKGGSTKQDRLTDLRKAEWYVKREIQRIEKIQQIENSR